MGNRVQNSGRMTRLACVLLGGTALVAIGACPAAAQSDSAGVQVADSGQANKTETKIEQVVVTALRREQTILDVPYNISSVSGDTIEQQHVLDTAELMRSIPGVSTVDRGDRNANVVSGIRIRGLNVDSSALGDYAVSAAATVSTYVNDTPIFANFLLSDVDRVEVLRGPQGTLYGSGALGGTVRYITRAPVLGEFEGYASASIDNVNHSGSIGVTGTLTLNIPLGDTLALRVSGTRNYFPGETDYVSLYKLDASGVPLAPSGVLSNAATYTSKKDADFAHQWYGRAELLWKPTSNFDVTLSFTGQSDSFGGRRGTSLGTDGNGVPYKDSQLGAAQLEPSARGVTLSSLEANLDLGFATLTSSTSYYDNHGNVTSENTGFYAQNGWLRYTYYNYYNYPRPMATAVRHYGDKAFIQELRLVSKTGRAFDYVVGGYFQNQQLLSTQDSFLRGFKAWWDAAYPAFASSVIDEQDYLYREHENFRDAAVYGELTYHITDTLDATGGFRYFNDKSTTHVYQVTGVWYGRDTSSTSNTVGSTSASKALFKGNVSWKFTRDDLLYATVSQGYRRGGSNGTPTTGNFAESAAWLTYKPDTDLNYEIGVKGVIGSIFYNADIFWVDWHNPQINTATTVYGFFAVQNGSKATTKGLEAQISGSLGDNLHYGLGYTYTEATLGADLWSADGAYQINTKGATLPGAPKHMLNIAVDYSIPVGNGSKLTLHVDGFYQSSTQDTIFSKTSYLNAYNYTGQPKFYYPMSGFSVWNASASYPMGDWLATLWVKNVFDARAITGVYTPAYMGTSPDQNYYGNGSKALTALPRTIGLSVNYNF
jgi:outer membrane receptor protein involved in Fe transport